jgi:NitT/TauT family transport system substrate-binding protein
MRLLVVLLAILVAIAPPSAAVRAQTPIVLHVATGGKESDAQVYYAQDLGYFARAGLSVEISTMSNGAAIASAVASNAIQIGSSNILAIATARQRGLPFVFVAPGGSYREGAPTTQLCVAPNAPYRSGKDLTGKTIGTISLRALDQTSVMAWIDRTGGDSSSVHFVEITTAEMPVALERGAVAKQFLIAGWFARSDWVAQNAAAVRRFDDAIAQTAQWANANPAKAAAILEKYSKIPPNPNANHLVYATKLEPAAIAPVLALGVKYRVLSQLIPASELIAQ